MAENHVSEKEVAEQEKRILDETEKIEAAEERIDLEEKKILHAEHEVLDELKDHPIHALSPGGINFKEASYLRTVFARRISRHRVISMALATIGVVLIWRGIWHAADQLPVVSVAGVSLLIGVLILWLINRSNDFK